MASALSVIPVEAVFDQRLGNADVRVLCALGARAEEGRVSRSRFLGAAEIVADLKFRRQVKHLHQLGPRAVGELLAEIGAERSIMTLIDQKIDTYATLDPKVLEATGGDGFWPAPIHEVR